MNRQAGITLRNKALEYVKTPEKLGRGSSYIDAFEIGAGN